MSFAALSPEAAGASWAYRAAMAREWGTIQQDRRRGTFYLEFWVDGKPYRVRRIQMAGGGFLPIRTREMAGDVLESIRADYRNGRTQMQALAPYLRPDASELAVATWWGRFVESKRAQGDFDRQLSPRRLAEFAAYERRGYLVPLWGMAIHNVTAGALEDVRAHLFGKGLAPKTVWNVLTDVGVFLRWLERRGEIGQAPPLPRVHVPDHTPRIPSRDVQARILAAIPEDSRGQYLARGLMGLRPSEAWRALGAHASPDGLVVVGKGGRNRVLPWAAEVWAWVEAHPAPPFAPLFPNPRGKLDPPRWTRESSRRAWRAACKAAGVGMWEENESLRHAFATHAAGAGVDMELLSRFLGHTNGKTTRRYSHTGAGELVRVLPK